MLSNEHWLTEFDFARRRVLPDRLTRFAHAAYLDHARRMILCYQQGPGQSRQELHRQIESILADDFDCPPRRCAAFCRILDAQSEFDEGRDVDAARLRKTVFRMAARHHPLVEEPEGLFASDRASIQTQIAAALGRSWNEIEQELFADISECHRLHEYLGVSEPEQLLALYNVAQTQATLAASSRVVIKIPDSPASIIHDIRRLDLPHEVFLESDGHYHVHVERPAGKRNTNRIYTIATGELLLSLIARDNWQLEATIQRSTKQKSLSFVLRHDDGLTCPISLQSPPKTSLADQLWEQWIDRPIEDWELQRSTSPLHIDRNVLMADFQLTSASRETIHLEILPTGSKSLLQRRCDSIGQFPEHSWIIATSKFSADEYCKLEIPANCQIHGFNSSPSIDDILAICRQLEALRQRAANRGNRG